MSDRPTTTTTVVERGPWRAGREGDDAVRGVYIESDDFTHDVRLYVNGDFESVEQRVAYAQEIAGRLNSWSPS